MLILNFLLLVIGFVGLIKGADWFVDGSAGVARKLRVSSIIIGLTIVAFGTSLPELVTSITAAKKNAVDIAIGNIIGSNIFNILFVAGLAGIFSPSPIGFEASFIIDACVAIFAAVLLWLCVFRDGKLGRTGGIIMILCYAAYFVYLVLQPMIFGR